MMLIKRLYHNSNIFLCKNYKLPLSQWSLKGNISYTFQLLILILIV